MEERNCMVQYATAYRIIENTDLITLEEALKLFDKYAKDFIHDLDEDPELVLWVDCKDNSSYGKTLHHWCSGNFKNLDGQLYRKVNV